MRIPAVKWPGRWQWNSHVPTLSGTMSATIVAMGFSMIMSVRMCTRDRCLAVPVSGMDVLCFLFVRIREQVPSDALALTHRQHRSIAIYQPVDRPEVVEIVNPLDGAIVVLRIPVSRLRLKSQSQLRCSS